jgi:hypothetical protein
MCRAKILFQHKSEAFKAFSSVFPELLSKYTANGDWYPSTSFGCLFIALQMLLLQYVMQNIYVLLI